MAENIHLDVDISGVTQVVEALQLRLLPSELRTFLSTVAHDTLAEEAEARFAAEGDSTVGKWAELTFATGRIRSFQGFQPFHPINVRTGQLKNFVMSTFTVKTSGSTATLSMPGPASGELLSKFRVAQQGGFGTGGVNRKTGFGRGSAAAVGGGMSGRGRPTGPNRPAPPRPVIAISRADAVIIPHRLLDWLRAGIF